MVRDYQKSHVSSIYSIDTIISLLKDVSGNIHGNCTTTLADLWSAGDMSAAGGCQSTSPNVDLGVQVKLKEDSLIEEPDFQQGNSHGRSSISSESQDDNYLLMKQQNPTDLWSAKEVVQYQHKTPAQIENEKFREKFFNKELNRFVCHDCGSSYTTKENFLKHISSKNRCKNKKLQQTIMNASEDNALKIFDRESKSNDQAKIFVVQNIGCVNNIQNICNNVQNITNNSTNIANQNTMNLSLRDFIHENFDISHLNKEITNKDDFFLYPNFLKAVMENESNHNIFFTGKEAIVYTDNELNRMTSDKAGYMVMDKLSKSCSELIERQDEETRQKLDHVETYYRVSKGQYVNDTTYREYSVEHKRFLHTAADNMFRNRDKIHNKIISTLRPLNQIVRQKLMSSGLNIYDIPVFDPKIEYYSSVRCRYKE